MGNERETLSEIDVFSWWDRCSEFRQKEAAKELKLTAPEYRYFGAKINREKVESFIYVHAGEGTWPSLYPPNKVEYVTVPIIKWRFKKPKGIIGALLGGLGCNLVATLFVLALILSCFFCSCSLVALQGGP